MSLYYCSSCADTIPLHKPRINCNDCRFHNICANCYVLNIFTGQHVQGHTTRVIPKSGRVLPPPLPARHSPTTIPQPQPQGRPEIGRRPVGGPSISQQIPEYVSQPIPSPYGHPVGNINRMSYRPPQVTPPLAPESTLYAGAPYQVPQHVISPQQSQPPDLNRGPSRNQEGDSPKLTQYVPQVPQPQLALYGSGEWNINSKLEQSSQYITPPPQSTPSTTSDGYVDRNPQQKYQHAAQSIETATHTTVPGYPEKISEQINQSECVPSLTPVQTIRPLMTEQVGHALHQDNPPVSKVGNGDNTLATNKEDFQVPLQSISPVHKEELAPLVQQDIPAVPQSASVCSGPSDDTNLGATGRSKESTETQGIPPVAKAESFYGTPQPTPSMLSGTAMYSQTYQSATSTRAREESEHSVPRPMAPMDTTFPTPSQLPQTGLPASGGEPSIATSSWNPIFDGCIPSVTGAAFFNTVFDCLDTERKGMITPEQYSAFNDVQGYELHEDIWKRSNVPKFGFNSEDLADYEFRTVLKNYSFDHVLRKRVTAPNNDMSGLLDGIPGLNRGFAKLMSKTRSPSILDPPASGGMPLLTRDGFIEITTLEMLGDLTKAWQRFNRIARHYNIWRDWGDCPREMFPVETPGPVKERIARVSAFSQRQAQELIEAARVQAELQDRGRENALRITDPTGTRYIYRY